MLRPHQEIYLAELLRAHRKRLEEIAGELGQRPDQPSEFEARLLALVEDGRLADVEATLRDAARSGPLGRLHWLMFLISAAMSPRIGLLRHHEPKPISLPEKYLLTVPP